VIYYSSNMETKSKLRSLKDFRAFKHTKVWVANLPAWVRSASLVILVSFLTTLFTLFFYDRFWGNSPWSNRQRLVKEALEICNTAQTLAYDQVDFTGWPLDKTFGLEGYTVGDMAEFLSDSTSYGTDGPSNSEAAQAYAWLQDEYSEYFTAQSRCDSLAEEYQQKYAY
jgi:hypothetical protein